MHIPKARPALLRPARVAGQLATLLLAALAVAGLPTAPRALAPPAPSQVGPFF
jgi:hypothetical protein